MWDDYSDYGYGDYGGYSDYSYPSYDYSSYSSPSYDYSSYYSSPSYDYSSYSSPSNYNYGYDSSYDNLNTNTGWGNETPAVDYSLTSASNYPSVQTAGPVNYSDLNSYSEPIDNSEIGGGFNPGQAGSGDTYDSFGNPVQSGSAAATGADQYDYYNQGQTMGPPTPEGNVNPNEYNYTSGNQVGPVMPGQTQPYDNTGYDQTRSLGGQQGYGQITPNSYGQGGAMGPAYPGYGGTPQQTGYGVGTQYGQGPGGGQASQGWDWNHPIDSTMRALGLNTGAATPSTGGGSSGIPGLGGGTGTGGSSGGLFDWLGNNIGGLAAGAAGLYALNKLMNSGSSGSSSGVTPTAGYGAVGGAVPIKPAAVQLNTPTAASNPGNYIGQMGIQGLPKA